MKSIAIAALALALPLAVLDPTPSRAAGIRLNSVGQHRYVMNNIARAQRRNNALINSVQRNIRANQRRGF